MVLLKKCSNERGALGFERFKKKNFIRISVIISEILSVCKVSSTVKFYIILNAHAYLLEPATWLRGKTYRMPGELAEIHPTMF